MEEKEETLLSSTTRVNYCFPEDNCFDVYCRKLEDLSESRKTKIELKKCRRSKEVNFVLIYRLEIFLLITDAVLIDYLLLS